MQELDLNYYASRIAHLEISLATISRNLIDLKAVIKQLISYVEFDDHFTRSLPEQLGLLIGKNSEQIRELVETNKHGALYFICKNDPDFDINNTIEDNLSSQSTAVTDCDEDVFYETYIEDNQEPNPKRIKRYNQTIFK